MGKSSKRHHDEDSSSSSSKVGVHKKPHSSSTSNNAHPRHESQSGQRFTFVSYLEVPNLPPKLKILCEIIATTPSATVEKVLEDTGIRVSQEDAEEVLKLSYGHPGPAVKFFRWAGYQLLDKHSPYAWNLVVDLLGKNCLFDAMWDAIKSMKKERLLSLATFASVFSSYVTANRVQEAVMAFEVMDQYGCPRDIVALNSLLSAICRERKTREGYDFFRVVKGRIVPDMDTYAILLEGWESEGDESRARQMFSDMVVDIGWDPRNVSAYDSFLSTLLKGRDGFSEAMKFFGTMKDRGCLPGAKFFKFAFDECLRKNDLRGAEILWDAMIDNSACKPDAEMYRSMVSLHCNVKNSDGARKLLDQMVYTGVFPDSKTYNVFFHFLIRSRRLKEATPIFLEMVKNECMPSHENCRLAVRIYIDDKDSQMAIKVWKFMIDNYSSDLEETGNMLVLGLRDMNRLPEAVKYAEDMIERRIKLNSSSLSKLKQSLVKLGKAPVYDELLRKWKFH